MNRKHFVTVALALTLCIGAGAQEQEIRVFSHRGGRMEFDENTLEAFQASADAGYRGFETDIRITKDGVLVIAHDATLERCTNGTGVLEEKTLKEIKALTTKGGHKMITLDEFLKFLKPLKGLYVEFELKTSPDLYPDEKLYPYCDKLYKAVMAAKPADAEFIFTSSDYRGLRYLQQKHSGVDLLLITGRPLDDETIRLCKAMGIKRVGATMDGTSRRAVKEAHKAGLGVSLWPGHSVEDLMLGAYLGADYLCTDKPIEYMRFAAEKAPWLKVKY